MLEHGFLERHGPPDTVEQVLAFKHAENGVPDLVTCEPHEKLGAAIELMQRYGISQLPVVRHAPAETLADVIGSLNERDAPRPRLPQPGRARRGRRRRDAAPARRRRHARLGRRGVRRPARAEPGGRRRARRASPQAVLTRSDLLEYLAHRR